MSSNEQNLCTFLREEWFALINLIDFMSNALKKQLQIIQGLLDRIRNTIISRLLSTIRSLQDYLSGLLGLQTLDSARNDFCSVLYNCLPALEKISKFVSPPVYNAIFGSDPIDNFNLNEYGITGPSHFNSKYELMEYYVCRLSFRSVLNGITNKIISNILEFLSKFDKYFDINWWLHNTVWGRQLLVLINEYELIFSNIKTFINKLIPYLDCAFSLCDFKFSTQNYIDNLKSSYKLEQVPAPNLKYQLQVSREEIYSSLTDSFSQAKNEMNQFKVLTDRLTKTPPDFHNKTIGESVRNKDNKTILPNNSQTTPFTTTEQSIISNNMNNRDSSLIPGVTQNSQSNYDYRKVIVQFSPNTNSAQV